MKHLDRWLMYMPVAYGLCTSEAEYERELKRIKAVRVNPFLNKHAGATTHFFDRDDAPGLVDCELLAIVCIHHRKDMDPIRVAALLCHEAVHIFQWCCAQIGEKEPSDEFQAYSIQWVAQELMFAYRDSLPT